MRLPGAGSNQGNRDVIFFRSGGAPGHRAPVRRNDTLGSPPSSGVWAANDEFNTAGYNDDWIDTDTRTDQDR